MKNCAVFLEKSIILKQGQMRCGYPSSSLSIGQRTQRGRCSIEQREEFPSVRGGQGLSKGRRGLEGEQGSWGLEAAEGLKGGGLDPQGTGRTDVCSFGRSLDWTFGHSLVQTDGRKFLPLFYRTSSPSDPLPKRKKERKKERMNKRKR